MYDLAIRVYMSPATRFNNPDVGGLHAPPVLGLATTVQLMQAADRDALLHSQFGTLLQAVFLPAGGAAGAVGVAG